MVSILVANARVDVGVVVVEERSAITCIPRECLSSDVHVGVFNIWHLRWMITGDQRGCGSNTEATEDGDVRDVLVCIPGV